MTSQVTLVDVKVEAGSSMESPPKVTQHNRNVTLERESLSCFSLVFYSTLFVMLDVWKQVTSYGMKYFNNNVYPMPQTQVVAITEVFKFSLFVVSFLIDAGGFRALCKIRVSLWYAVPAIIYSLTNNIYYYALHFVTPPVWNVLIQLRIVFTALSYRAFFKRSITPVQWLGLILLITALTLTNYSGGQTLLGQDQKILIAFFLATLVSCISIVGSLTMEYLFKNDNRSFHEMQMYIYGFGSIATWLLYALESLTRETPPWKGDPALIHSMLIGCIILSCLSGVVVALIVKKLDNIVKLYTQSVSNMLTSVACTVFFPDHFHINFTFFACLILIFIGISLYESPNLGLKTLFCDFWNWITNAPLKDMLFFIIGALTVLIVLFFLLV
ncbi:hypothetical protein CAPTEDRAFT_205655 [Capitella teleta]|uniref:EamA domain-containing protein n=1 Tax=Capitella teleta TaxID=283909 RepID=R7T8Y4_CAPTE|nr:hypothetical protein CAPTEDRAFT_205655 [Capitella teleta]|eukprot:ELT90198.1 hypothetical protein CAPTEDRAFT_205655 [Capitella teleta]